MIRRQSIHYAEWADDRSACKRIRNAQGEKYMQRLPREDKFPDRPIKSDWEHEIRFNIVLRKKVLSSDANQVFPLDNFATYCYDAGLPEFNPVDFDINLAEGLVTALMQPYFIYRERNIRHQIRIEKPTKEDKHILVFGYHNMNARFKPIPEDKLKTFSEYKNEFLSKKSHQKTLKHMYLALRKDLEHENYYRKTKEFIGWLNLVQKLDI